MEITANSQQAIQSGDNVIFDTIRTLPNASIVYQPGSGIVTLRGLCRGCCDRARFRVKFTGNIKADASETISAATLLYLSIAQNGEIIPSSTMITTVANTTSTYNIGTEILIDVPGCCSQTISIKNSTPNLTTIDILNANLIVERVA